MHQSIIVISIKYHCCIILPVEDASTLEVSYSALKINSISSYTQNSRAILANTGEAKGQKERTCRTDHQFTRAKELAPGRHSQDAQCGREGGAHTCRGAEPSKQERPAAGLGAVEHLFTCLWKRVFLFDLLNMCPILKNKIYVENYSSYRRKPQPNKNQHPENKSLLC